MDRSTGMDLLLIPGLQIVISSGQFSCLVVYAGFSFTMTTIVSDSFLHTLMVSALFCADSAAPENTMAQMIVKILFISLHYLIRLQRYGKRLRNIFQKNRQIGQFCRNLKSDNIL